MDINEIEENLNNLQAEPNRVLSVILNLSIANQARQEVIMNTQAMIMSQITDSMSYEDLMNSFGQETNKRISEIKAQVASKII